MSDFQGDLAKAWRLLDEGRRHLETRDFRRAETCFRDAAGAAEIPAARNNLALCRHMRGDHWGALKILNPLLQCPTPAPFSRALASRAFHALGDRGMALKSLKEAMRDFEVGLASPLRRGGLSESDWVEYSLAMEQAALELGEHKMVLDLHNRLPGRQTGEEGFLAGIAAFNLGRYEQAAKYWRRVSDPNWVRPLSAFVWIAELSGQGVIPRLILDGEPVPDPSKTKNPEKLRESIRTRHTARVPLLAAFFDPAAGLPRGTLRAFIAETGEWGVELGRRVLRASQASVDLKMEAAQALVDAGIFALDEPIPIIHEGRSTTMVIRRVQLRDPDPELDRKVAQAKRLRDEGRKDEAYHLLTELEEEGVAYPPAMLTLANLKRERGELEDALGILEVLKDALPDDQAVLFNLAALYLQKEDLERARQHAARLNPEGQSPAFQRSLRQLKECLAPEPGPFDPLAMADSFRLEEEEKPILLDATLKRALKALPVQWLNAIAAVYRVGQVPKRPQRELCLAEALEDPLRLRRALDAEPPGVRAALRLLLQRGGWCKLATLTRRFGKMDGDGYWWVERLPASTVGRLRLLGIAFVGRTRIDDKTHKVAVVPLDLRPLLASYL